MQGLFIKVDFNSNEDSSDEKTVKIFCVIRRFTEIGYHSSIRYWRIKVVSSKVVAGSRYIS